MTLCEAIDKLNQGVPSSVSGAQDFLNTLPLDVQQQLISAIYLGSDHMQSSKLRDDLEISRSYTDHIGQDQYAEVLHKKRDVCLNYLNKLQACANASGFDLNKI